MLTAKAGPRRPAQQPAQLGNLRCHGVLRGKLGKPSAGMEFQQR